MQNHKIFICSIVYGYVAVYLSHALSAVVVEKNPCLRCGISFTCFYDYCCNFSVSMNLNEEYTANRICVKNNAHIHVAWTSNNRVILAFNHCRY